MFLKICASGTNVQRVAKASGSVDGAIFASYTTLEREEPSVVKRKFFCSDTSAVSAAVQALNEELQPTWSKAYDKVNGTKAFHGTLIQHLTGDHDGLDNRMNLSEMMGVDVRCFMMLTSAKKAGMDQLAKVYRAAVPNWEILVLNGNHTTNEKAQALTKERLDFVKLHDKAGLIIITNQMGSRSYSVPEIQATVIAYDRGSADAMEQKNSRGLTPGYTLDGDVKQFGAIVDLSFDPNRSQNIELLTLNEILMVQREDNVDFPTAAKTVLNSMNLFKVDGYGRTKQITLEEMMKVFGENDNLLLIADVSGDIKALAASSLVDELIEQLSKFKDPTSGKKAKLAPNAKSVIKTEGKKRGETSEEDKKQQELEDILNRAIRAINRSATSVALMVLDGKNFRDCINKIAADKELSSEFEDLWGVMPATVVKVCELGALNEALLDVVVMNSKNIELSC